MKHFEKLRERFRRRVPDYRIVKYGAFWVGVLSGMKSIYIQDRFMK